MRGRRFQRIHFIGICGRAMGAIAIALARAGHRITGSDEGMYEPMSGCLRRAGIHVATHYAAANVPSDTDLIVVGKRVSDANRELQSVIVQGLAIVSFPKLLHQRFLRHSRNAVIAGGVGKTTTTAMLAWILEHAGVQPDYLVGGMARNLASSARFDGRGITVLEGDEYASCFNDPTPKFLQYAPEVVAVTNILADHPDLYPDVTGLHNAFRSLVRLLPADGCLVLSADDETAAKVAGDAGCTVVSTGFGRRADRPISRLRLTSEGSAFRLNGAAFEIPLHGRMNVRNAAMAAIVAAHFGVSCEQSAKALAEFQGVADRQEAREVGGCTLVTDKASHPDSLTQLCQALRQRYPERRIISVIQPRATGGRHWIYQRDLPMALAGFDKVIMTSAYEHAPAQGTTWRVEPFCIETLAHQLRALDVDVTVVRALADVPETVRETVQDDDVVLLSLREQFVAQIAAVEAALLDRHAAA